jgi:hypothetical protein
MNDMNALWIKHRARYLKMRSDILSGRHPLSQPFPLDPADQNSPRGTLEQLAQFIGMELRYQEFVKSLAKKQTRDYYKTLAPDAARDARLARTRELARMRAQKRRARVSELLRNADSLKP